MRSFGTEDKLWANLSVNHCRVGGGRRIPSEVKRALSKIVSFPNNVRLNEDVLGAMEIVISSDVCLSPGFFFTKKGGMHSGIYAHFVNETEFGSVLYQAIEEKGHFEFLGRLETAHQFTKGQLDRIFAVFSMCTFGVSTLAEVPLDMIHAIVDWFRSEDGTAWNTEIWGRHDVGIRCLGAVIRGLAEVFNDPRLLGKSNVARGAGSKTWKEFSLSRDPLCVELTERLNVALETATIRPTKTRQAIMDIAAWCEIEWPNKTLAEVMASPPNGKSFSKFLEARLGHFSSHIAAQTSIAFTLLDAFRTQIILENPETDFHPMIREQELKTLRIRLGRRENRPASSRSRPLAEKLVPIAIEILDEGEAGWPGQCGHFDVTVQIDGKRKKIYCPVIPMLFRNMIDMPARMAQWRRQDSGEGDVVRYNSKAKRWEPNTGPLAGYWADQEGKERDGFPTRGYASRLEEGGEEVTGVFMNTNKTGEPYVIPWQHEEVLARMEATREWQSKFNPIKVPITPAKYVDQPHEYPKATLARMPSIFPLARLFPTGRKSWPGRIATTSEMDHAWANICAEIERRYNEQNPEKTPIQIVQRQATTGQAQSSIYTIHGLRSRGLTRLYRSGVPIEMLSRVVAGHASILMTIYYLQFGPDYVNRILSAAAIKARAEEQQTVINEFKTCSLDDARARAVAMTPGAVDQAHASPSKVEYCNTGVGMCPFDCTRCKDGGPVVRKDGDKTQYGPVQGDEQNCVLCRHFVTGPAWLVPLELLGTKLLERRKYLAQEKEKINGAVSYLEQDYASGKIDRALYEQRIDAHQEKMLRKIDEQIEWNETSIVNVSFYITACLEMIKNDPSANGRTQFVAGGQEAALKYVEVTEYEQAATVVDCAIVMPFLEDNRVRSYRDRILDQVLFNSGITPPSLLPNVSDEARTAAMTYVSRYLMGKAKRNDLAKLTEGATTLRDLRLDTQVRNVISKAISSPLMLRAPIPLELEAIED